jgi:hypothetical protein
MKTAKALTEMGFPILLKTKLGLSPIDLAIIDEKVPFIHLLTPKIQNVN